jgi:hypothetical protein
MYDETNAYEKHRQQILARPNKRTRKEKYLTNPRDHGK